MRRKSSSKHSRKQNANQLRCPCGCQAVLRPFDEMKPGAMAYVCIRYPLCDSYVMAKPDSLEPMGTLAGPELRRMRRAAHISFNRIYETGLMTKRDAYKWLSDIVQAPMEHAHIGHLGEYYCKVVIQESEKLLASHKNHLGKRGGKAYASTH